jgi:hypothetical protein
MLSRAQRQSVEYKTGFMKGRKNGIYLAYHKIFPLPTEDLSKDMAREAARQLRMPRYSQVSQEELKQYIINRGYDTVLFKAEDGEIQLVKR